MSLFEDISVIPLYIGIVRIEDTEKDIRWDEQVYIGLKFDKAISAVIASQNSEWPKTVSRVVGIIRFYHVLPNGDVRFLMEREQ